MSNKRDKMSSPQNGTDSVKRENGALAAGTVLKERYQLEKVLGRGGFGITYRALDRNVQVSVAVKEYLTESGAQTERAMKEARIAASLYDLEGIVAVRDYFVENGIAYIVMEYVHGISVKQFVAQHGRMNGAEVLADMKPLLLSIQKIHEKGIIHRDISADNLMITKEGKLKLIDFGAASILNPKREEHTVLIKRGFVPVEQYRAEEKLGPWTDVYSLCATMYFMITGMVPEDAMERWISDSMNSLVDIYGTGLTQGQSQAIMKGLSVKKEDRYPNLTELRQALYDKDSLPAKRLWNETEELAHQTLAGHTSTFQKEAAKFLAGNGKKKGLWGIVGGVAAVALVVVLWINFGGNGFLERSGSSQGNRSGKAVVVVSPTVEATVSSVVESPSPKRTVSPTKDTKAKSKKKASTKKPVVKKTPKPTKTPKKPAATKKQTKKTPSPTKNSGKKQKFEGNLDELLE